jgi:DNA-binding PadR family transcriptional regulator
MTSSGLPMSRAPFGLRCALTATLRSLERDGLLTRDVYAEVPPRVEYELTPLGREFMQPVRGLVSWLQGHWVSIKSARATFDRRSRSSKAPPARLTTVRSQPSDSA